MSGRSRSWQVLWLAVLPACSGSAPEVGTTRVRLAGGVQASDETSVVGIVVEAPDLPLGSRLCSGTLIGASAVLTAQHCLWPSDPPFTSCDEAGFPDLVDPSAVLVTLGPDVYGFPFHAVAAVLRPEGDTVCGSDVAVLALAEAVPEGEAGERAPSAEAASTGQGYTAYGYGVSCTDEDEACSSLLGFRQRGAEHAVECVREGCLDGRNHVGEWGGADGVCDGDSGGPAVDTDGRVLGVASRSVVAQGQLCTRVVYEDVAGVLPFLSRAVRKAAGSVDLEPPDWVLPDDAPRASEGCAAAPGRGAGPAAPLLLSIFLVARRLRTRALRGGSCTERPRRLSRRG